MKKATLWNGVPLILVLLTGCSAIDGFSSRANPQLDRLESTLAQCSAVQVGTQQQLSQQLRLQQEQLVQQGEKLDAMAESITASRHEHLDRAPIVSADILPITCVAPETSPAKLIVGRREKVWLDDVQLALSARVDTGAETASLDAHNIEMFERNGKRWVRFEIIHPDSGETLQLERRLKRFVSIIQANTSEPERRPVIKLGITIGSVKQYAEFTLSNRSHLDYQILIGRNILRDVMIVDVSKTNIAPPILSGL